MKNSRFLLFVIILSLLVGQAFAQSLLIIKPKEVGMCSSRLNMIGPLIKAAIEKEEIPGAAILVARKGKIVLREAFGCSQWVPEKKPMKIDKIFDLASVTKPVATATSIMILVEQGRLRLWDKVKQYIPEFSTFVDDSGKTKGDARI